MLQPNFIAADAAAQLSVSAARYVVSWLTLAVTGSIRLFAE